jgi:hypothetical protein
MHINGAHKVGYMKYVIVIIVMQLNVILKRSSRAVARKICAIGEAKICPLQLEFLISSLIHKKLQICFPKGIEF